MNYDDAMTQNPDYDAACEISDKQDDSLREFLTSREAIDRIQSALAILRSVQSDCLWCTEVFTGHPGDMQDAYNTVPGISNEFLDNAIESLREVLR